VVDDGSTDNTQEVVKSFQDPRIRYIYQENQGVSAAQNTGTDVSTGEYICGLGSDDMYLPTNLEQKVKVLDSRPEVGLVCSDAYIFDNKTGNILGRYWHDKPFHYWVDPERASRQPLRELLTRGCFIAPQTILVRRHTMNEVGSFDESLPTHEDWDLFIRIAQRFAIETIDVPLLKLRRHDVSLTASWDNMYQGAVTILNKVMRSYSFSKAELRLVEKRLARTHFSYGKSLVANGNASLGREKLLAGIQTYPWSVKPYIYLAWSLLGNELILSLKSIKNRLGNFIFHKPTSIKAKI
jgi:glycosyltransferase involved in cell wall biosynthesis